MDMQPLFQNQALTALNVAEASTLDALGSSRDFGGTGMGDEPENTVVANGEEQ
jgi:hypothetical protein